MTVSIIIPVAPYHFERARRAIESAKKQTVPAEIIVIHDEQGRGAAWARNEGARQSSGEWLIFLDADDELDPKFVETCLKYYKRGQFVYTDWIEDGTPKQVEPCNTWHPARVYHFITTLLPRAMFEDLGGFLENVPLEDADFYLRARFRGWYGIHVKQALWHYHRSEGGSPSNSITADKLRISQELTRADRRVIDLYGKYFKMPCCGNKAQPPSDIQTQPGDVLAVPLFTQKMVVGTYSGRKYKLKGLYRPLWVDPKDAEARPDQWKIQAQTEAITPDVATAQALVSEALHSATIDDEPTGKETKTASATPKKTTRRRRSRTKAS